MSLEDLLKSDDRNDIILFLMSMDELMRAVSDQYAAMARCVVANKEQGITASAIVESLRVGQPQTVWGRGRATVCVGGCGSHRDVSGKYNRETMIIYVYIHGDYNYDVVLI